MSQGRPIKTLYLYIGGFVCSLVLTLTAYFAAVEGWWSGYAFIFGVMGLAFCQLIVQLVCFLHIDQEARPRWNLIFMLSTAGAILIVVAGTIWIMAHLDYNMMQAPAEEIEQMMMSEEGIQK